MNIESDIRMALEAGDAIDRIALELGLVAPAWKIAEYVLARHKAAEGMANVIEPLSLRPCRGNCDGFVPCRWSAVASDGWCDSCAAQAALEAWREAVELEL